MIVWVFVQIYKLIFQQQLSIIHTFKLFHYIFLCWLLIITYGYYLSVVFQMPYRHYIIILRISKILHGSMVLRLYNLGQTLIFVWHFILEFINHPWRIFKWLCIIIDVIDYWVIIIIILFIWIIFLMLINIHKFKFIEIFTEVGLLMNQIFRFISYSMRGILNLHLF